MRTRRKNAKKSYSIEKYNFDDSSADEGPQDPSLRRQKKVEDDDANFGDAEAAQDESNGESEAEAAAAVATSGSEASVEDDLKELSSRRIKPARTVLIKGGSKTAGYFDLEPIGTDSHQPRGYAGSLERHVRSTVLVGVFYGPDERNLEIAMELLERWIEWPLLPPRETVNIEETSKQGIWDTDVHERESRFLEDWLSRMASDHSYNTILWPLTEEESGPYRLQPGTLPLITGPRSDQQELRFSVGNSYILDDINHSCEPHAGKSQEPRGWVLDAGGIVLSLDWAHRRDVRKPQLLALAVIPHADQESYRLDDPSETRQFQQHGIVQIWEFEGRHHEDDSIRPAMQAPRLVKTLGLDTGRARKIKWSPAHQHLAILSGDGSVSVLEVVPDQDSAFERVQKPLVMFTLEDEVKATAMTWVSFNRLSIGYSDGSIALWSIYPRCLLMRHPVHHSSILDMVSGYPTLPYIVASTPIGGVTKLVDLRTPSYETTEVPTLSITTSSNVLAWSDHMLGFFSLLPSSNTLNTLVGFMHHAHFPVARRAYTSESFVTSIAVGRTHPFLLVGSADGSLGAINPHFEVIQVTQNRRERTERIRIFQHEHRPKEHFPPGSPASQRGVSRIIHGFKPSKNRNPKSEAATAKKNKKKKKLKVEEEEEEEEAGDDETAGPADPSRGIVYEPLSRVTAVEWNPNDGYGCWAAAALGSGLVKVMDLGIDMPGDNKT